MMTTKSPAKARDPAPNRSNLKTDGAAASTIAVAPGLISVPAADAAVTNHIAAIHTLKSKLRLTDDDYRALLIQLTGKSSSKDCTQAQRAQVRDHMQQLAVRLGLARPTRSRRNTFAQSRAAASPRERKVWALWNALGRAGRVENTSAKALNAWVERQVSVSALRFCTGPQLDTLIEALKFWEARR
jgi:phage gp16-like protein